MKCYAVRYV